MAFSLAGRNERIRTTDPFHPKEVRYQAALRPDVCLVYYRIPSQKIHLKVL